MSITTLANTILANPATIDTPMSISNPSGYAIGLAAGTAGASSLNWTIVNTSTISAGGAIGIGLAASGSLTNASTGLVSATFDGISSRNASSVQNFGTITVSGVQFVAGTAVNVPAFQPPGLPQTGTISAGDGVNLSGAASSIDNHGLIAGASVGVAALGSASTVLNSGLIEASTTRVNEAGLPTTLAAGQGVAVANGTVGNTNGTIVGGLAGVVGLGLGPSSVVNTAGTIAGTGPTSVGILLEDGGAIRNQIGGTISGGVGIGITYGNAAVANYGLISATDSAQRAFPFADAVGNPLSAFLQSAAPDQLGMLRAAGAGVGMLSGGSVSNGASGTITGVAAGVYLAGAPLSLANAGSITATDPEGIGVFLQGNGSASNFGDITAPIFGVVTGNGLGHVLNGGVIDATGGTLGATSTDPLLTEAGFGSAPAGTRLGWGVFEDAGGTVTNGSAASTGWIIGAGNGVVIAGGAGTVVNADGTISGAAGVGVLLSAGGTVGNAAGQRIEGASAGIVITGSAGGTVSNAGTIAGTGGAGADSVLFSDSGTNLLQITPGATFAGDVSFAAGATNDLELLSAASTGSLSGLGTRFAGAGQVTVDPGAAWDLVGQNTLSGSDVVSLGSLANRGTLFALAGSGGSVISAGPASFANDGLIENISGTLTMAAIAAGTGRIAIAAGSAMRISSTVDSGQTIDLAGPGAVLALGNAAQFAGTIEGFGGTATIDLANTTLSAAALTASALDLTLAAGGTLSLAMAAPVAGATVQVAADGSGGTNVVFGVPSGTPGQGSLDLSAYAPGAEAAAAASLAGLAASGGPVRYDDAAASFGTAQAGATNIAVLTAPVAGSTLAPPTGFAGLAVTGSAALTLGDGGAGHALLIGNQGADTITGGAGDTLIGGQGANMFVAGAGVDIVTGDGADTVNAPAGADTVTTGAGGSLLFLGGANDMVASNGADTIVGSNVTGQTEFLNAAGAQVYGGNNGANTVVNSGGQDTVAAGSGPETIFANAGGGLYELNASSALEFVGNTTGTGTILGGSGQATLFGGAGKYLYVMGSETTEFAIQQGAATMVGGTGNASVWAGTGGPDVFFQNGGSLLYDAQSSQSTVVDASGGLDPRSDVFFAGAGGAINVFNASNGNVFVGYGTGNTTLNGGGTSGNNIFFAGGGNTTIFGGHGNDTFVAGTGSAVIVPDYSLNVFEFTKGAAGGTETIWHFSAADQVDLFGYGAGAITGQSSAGGSTTVTLADNTRIIFAGVASLNTAQIHSF